MILRFPHRNLSKHAKVRRKGFAAAVEAAAQIEGGLLSIDSADWQRLTLEYLKRPTRLGDLVARVAKPTARLIDRTTALLPTRLARFRTQLASCSACTRRQSWLNAAPARLRTWMQAHPPRSIHAKLQNHPPPQF